MSCNTAVSLQKCIVIGDKSGTGENSSSGRGGGEDSGGGGGPPTASSINEIVIGYEAFGRGDNTALIGSSSITDVYFGGSYYDSTESHASIYAGTVNFDGDLTSRSTAAGTTGRSVTISAGSTTAGTANVTGGSLTIQGGAGTGSGAGGNILFKVANEGTADDTTVNEYATALTINDDTTASFASDLTVAGSLLGNNTVDGTLTINNSGNATPGFTVDGGRTDLYTNTGDAQVMTLNNESGTADQGAYISLYPGKPNNAWVLRGQIGYLGAWNSGTPDGNLYFRKNNGGSIRFGTREKADGTTKGHYMVLNEEGNLSLNDGTSINDNSGDGARTTYKLHVTGDVKVTGELYFDGDLTSSSTAAGTTGRSVTISAGSTTAGTANVTGGSLTIQGGAGTGSGAGGNILFKVANEGTADQTTVNSYVTALTINDDTTASFASDLTVGGAVTCVSLTQSSDKNLKNDIVTITNAMDNIEKINPVNYKLKNDPDQKTKMGVIAQELDEIFPDLVHKNTETLSVDYNSLIGLLIAGVKEQQQTIKTLSDKVKSLSNEVENLKKSN